MLCIYDTRLFIIENRYLRLSCISYRKHTRSLYKIRVLDTSCHHKAIVVNRNQYHGDITQKVSDGIKLNSTEEIKHEEV